MADDQLVTLDPNAFCLVEESREYHQRHGNRHADEDRLRAGPARHADPRESPDDQDRGQGQETGDHPAVNERETRREFAPHAE